MSHLESSSVLVVIVNYRTSDLVIDCLASLEAEVAEVPARVVVVDNASGDDSVPRISAVIRDRGWDSWASVMPLEKNGGFAAGNNAAIRPALASSSPPAFYWLLNPDAYIHPHALTALRAFLVDHPEVGLAGSRLEDPDGTPQRSAFRFPTVLSELENTIRIGVVSRCMKSRVVAFPVPQDNVEVDWVAGASLLVRRQVFDAVGLLDENYFMYYEEVDFCRRAREAGWPCWYVPASRVVHLVGQSSGVTSSNRALKRRPAYWFHARRRYFVSHLGRGRTVLANLAWSFGFLIDRTRRMIQRRPSPDPPHLFLDFVRYNFLPSVSKR